MTIKILSLFVLTILAVHYAKASAVPRIVEGREIVPGEVLYQVSIQNERVYLCGGAIISEQYVLSAAHCFIDDDDNQFIGDRLIVKAGTLDLDAPSGYYLAEVEEIAVPHNYYNSEATGYVHDIAVMKLKTKLDFDNNAQVRPIYLPYLNPDLTFVGERVVVSGYGQSTKLNVLMMEIQDIDKCKIYYELANSSEHLCGSAPRTDDQLYAGTTKGDDGSAVAYGNTVLGIVSTHASPAGKPNEPIVFTKVARYVAFIDTYRHGIYTKEMRVLSL